MPPVAETNPLECTNMTSESMLEELKLEMAKLRLEVSALKRQLNGQVIRLQHINCESLTVATGGDLTQTGVHLNRENGVGRLLVFDENCKPRIALSVRDDGEGRRHGRIDIVDEKEKRLLTMSALGESGALLVFSPDDDKFRVVISVDDQGGGCVAVGDAEHSRAALMATDDGGRVELRDMKSSLGALFTARDFGGSVNLYTPDGALKASLP